MKKGRASLMILFSAALFFMLGFVKNAYSDKWAIFLNRTLPDFYPLILNQTSLDNSNLQASLFRNRQIIVRVHSQENAKNPSLLIGYLKKTTNYDQLIDTTTEGSSLDQDWFQGIKADFLSPVTTLNSQFIPVLWKIEESKTCQQIWLKIIGIKIYRKDEKTKKLIYHIKDLLPSFYPDYRTTSVFDLKDYRLEQLKIKSDDNNNCVQ